MKTENIGLAAACSPKQRWFVLGVGLCATSGILASTSDNTTLMVTLWMSGLGLILFQWRRNRIGDDND